MRKADGEKNSLSGPWVARSLEMYMSPAYAVISNAERKILERLEIEHMQHGGARNGRLIVTYSQFAAHGVRRQSINEGLLRLEALGFIEVGRRGYRKSSVLLEPNFYKLTYLSSRHEVVGGEFEHAPKITNPWRRLDTAEKVQRALETAAKKIAEAKAATKAPKQKSPAVTCEVDDEADFAPAHRTRVGGA